MQDKDASLFFKAYWAADGGFFDFRNRN